MEQEIIQHLEHWDDTGNTKVFIKKVMETFRKHNLLRENPDSKHEHKLLFKDGYFARYREYYAIHGNQRDAFTALNDEFEAKYGFRKHYSHGAFKADFQRYNAVRGIANRVGKPKKIII